VKDELGPVEQRIWRDGVDLLVRTGGKEREVRSLLGQLAKKHGKAQLASAIAEVQGVNPANPRDYLVKLLRDRTNRNAVGRSNEPDGPPPGCSRCNDQKEITRQKPGATLSFELEWIPCPDCVEGDEAENP